MPVRKVLIEIDVIHPSHISNEDYAAIIRNYVSLFRYTSAIQRIEVYPTETTLVINPIYGTRSNENGST